MGMAFNESGNGNFTRGINDPGAGAFLKIIFSAYICDAVATDADGGLGINFPGIHIYKVGIHNDKIGEPFTLGGFHECRNVHMVKRALSHF